MAIKSGELIHVGNQVLVDRAQTAGPGQLNINSTKIYELGNYNSVATVRDTPDLTFSLESFDVSAEIESMITGVAFDTMADGTEIVLANVLPLDVASQFKAGRTKANAFDTVASVAIPYLSVESVSYNFGLTDNARQTISMRGDGIFYAEASAYVQTFTGAGPYLLDNPALPYRGDPINGVLDADGKRVRYALGVAYKSGKRLAYGAEYTETVTGTAADGTRTVTIVLTDPLPAGETLRVLYQSPTVSRYPQASNAPATATRPGAIRGRDIEVRVGGRAVTDRWSSIQSVTAEMRLTLDKDEEFGNYQTVSQDFDVPAVTGSIDIKPRDVFELLKRMRQIANVSTDNEVVGPVTSQPLSLEIILHSPDTGVPLKTIWIPDARFTLPGFSGTANSKLTQTLAWESDSGQISVYKGAKPA